MGGFYTGSGFPALQIQQPNLGGEIEKAMQIRAQMGQIQSQQQEQQLRGIQIKSAGIDEQVKELGLKNMQITQSALSDPNLLNDYNEWQSNKGTPPSQAPANETTALGGQLHPMAQFLAEKKGLPYMGPGGAFEVSKSFNDAALETANVLKTQGEAAKLRLENYDKQLGNMADEAAPVLAETDLAKQNSALAVLKAKVKYQPSDYPPDLVAKIDDINSAGDLAKYANYGKVHEEVIDLGTKYAQQQTAQSEALLKTRAAAGITDSNGALVPRAQGAIATVNSYTAIPGVMRNGLIGEMKNAPDWETFQKVQARADAAQESFQRSADARAQANAMKNVAVATQVATRSFEEDKTLATSLQATAGVRGELDMTQGGNQMASQAALTRFAEHEVKAGGMNRFNTTELNAMTKDAGSWARQFGAWIDKGRAGKPPAATANDINAILDMEDNQAKNLHDQNIGFIEQRYLPVGGARVGAVTRATPPATTAPKFSRPSANVVVEQ